MKKNKLIFILLCCLFCIVPVDAAIGVLEPGKFTVECVYEDGISIEAYYANGNYSLNYSNLKIANKVKTHLESTSRYFYKESEIAETILKNASCEPALLFTVVKQVNDETSVQLPLYALEKHKSRLHGGEDNDRIFMLSKIVPGFTPTDAYLVYASKEAYPQLYTRASLIAADEVTSEHVGTFIARLSLVAERIDFVEQIDTDTKMSFQSLGEQAASKRMYINLYKYKNKNNDEVLLAQKGKTITRVTNDHYLKSSTTNSVADLICFKESVKTIDTASTDSAYAYNLIRHNYSFKDKLEWEIYNNPEEKEKALTSLSCPDGALYGETSWTNIDVEQDEKTSICDVLPNTVLTLAKIISILQIVVPILLIGFTAFDIGKIVVSGNLEEELPKKKKHIIIRMIVVVFFFFLPVIVRLITAGVTEYDFGDVSCLFEKTDEVE